jgi:hypothetical protein
MRGSHATIARRRARRAAAWGARRRAAAAATEALHNAHRTAPRGIVSLPPPRGARLKLSARPQARRACAGHGAAQKRGRYAAGRLPKCPSRSARRACLPICWTAGWPWLTSAAPRPSSLPVNARCRTRRACVARPRRRALLAPRRRVVHALALRRASARCCALASARAAAAAVCRPHARVPPPLRRRCARRFRYGRLRRAAARRQIWRRPSSGRDVAAVDAAREGPGAQPGLLPRRHGHDAGAFVRADARVHRSPRALFCVEGFGSVACATSTLMSLLLHARGRQVDKYDFPEWKFSLYFMQSLPVGTSARARANTPQRTRCAPVASAQHARERRTRGPVEGSRRRR